jgi:hypothetical protein
MRLLSIEIISSSVIFLIMGAISFLFLHTTLSAYQSEKIHYQTTLFAYTKKIAEAKSDATVINALRLWKNKNPDFYHAVRAASSEDQVTQSLTQAILQSNFTIIQAQPFHFILSGHYADLFYLLNQLNQLPWPITITTLKILNATQFDIYFSGSVTRA